MNTSPIILTEEGLNELKLELEERVSSIRTKIANEIELARQQGDLSENAAYKGAMESKEFNEERIDQIKQLISNSIIKKGNSRNNQIDLGEEFKLIDTEKKQEKVFKLVGSNEADPSKNKISIESPIGKAVEGKKFGDTIEIELPSGKVEFVIERV